MRRRENDEVEIGDEKRSMIKEKEVMKREEWEKKNDEKKGEGRGELGNEGRR